MMAMRICCFLVMLLSILSLMFSGVSSTPPNHGFSAHIKGKPRKSHKMLIPQIPNEGKMGSSVQSGGEEYKDMGKIGSKPPRCENKCYGCKPCEAIQVPTTNSHVGVQYTNYEPEGWKCKCGHTFYSP